MLVHVVEEGLAESPEAELLARHYLADRPEIDTLILGCTHYPLLREAIGKAAGPEVSLVDSAEVTAESVSRTFAPPPRCFRQGRAVHYVTGDPTAFLHTARAFAEIEEALPLPRPLESGRGEAMEKLA
jgi:glutamate racemase